MKKKYHSLSKNQRNLGGFILITALFIIGYLSVRPIEQPNQPSFNLGITPPTLTMTLSESTEECKNSLSSGYIMYREGGNLHIQDADGCSSNLIFDNALSPPAWSLDGEKVAVECNNRGEICMLDAHLLFDRCVLPDNDKTCRLPVLEKYTICDQHTECQIEKISWSPNMDRLAISYVYENATGEEGPDRGSAICVFSLISGSCTIIYSDVYYAGLWVDWSPKDEMKLAVSDMRNEGTLFLLDPDGKNKRILAAGIYPTWSPDGKKIVFYKTVNEPNRPLFGIALIDADGSNLQWVFFPPTNDGYNRNLGVGCSDRTKGGMSWSPDLKHIVFAASYDSIYVCRLVQLDIDDGSIIFITPKSRMQPPKYYFDPIWKP